MADRKYVRYNGEEWSALYIDGQLAVVGDTYLSDERIAQLLGVEEHADDAFLRGGNSYSDVASTLTELNEYVAQRDELISQATQLRAQAAALEAQAKALRERDR